MAIGGVVISFVAKTADAVGDIGRLTRELTGVDKAAGGVGKTTGKMRGAVKAAGVVGLTAAGAIAGLGAALWDAGKGAYEEEQAYRKLADSLGKIPGITQAAIDKNRAWIGSMQLATGVAEDQLTVAVGNAARATGDLTSAQNLVAIAIDAGTASGKAWEPIAVAMGKAANGNTTALQKQFPWLKKGSDGTLTYADAMAQLTEKFGGAAEAAADNDPFKRLGIIFGELKDAVGQALVPLIDRFGKWMKDPANQKRITDITDAVSDMATAMGEDAVDAIEDLMKWLKDPKNQQALKNTAHDIAAIASAVGSLVGWLIAAASKLETFYGWVKKVDALTSPIGGGDVNWSSPPWGRTGSSAAPAATTRAGTTIGTLVYYGSGDLTRDAKKLKRLLEAEDLEQGRRPGQPLAVAW